MDRMPTPQLLLHRRSSWLQGCGQGVPTAQDPKVLEGVLGRGTSANQEKLRQKGRERA